ncbi:MAG: outer membrane beta-barrel protein [bacterium]
MRKIILLSFLGLSLLLSPAKSWARHTMAISGFGGANFQLTNTFPELDTGLGGGIAFDYRFNQRWGLSTALSVFSHDGKGPSSGDDGILLLGLPTVDLKFYFLKQEHWFDPYASAGLGIYVLTGGSKSDNSGGAGMGAQLAVGSDFYLRDWFSLGISTQFKTIGVIRGNNQSSAMIFLAALGNFSFHFK